MFKSMGKALGRGKSKDRNQERAEAETNHWPESSQSDDEQSEDTEALLRQSLQDRERVLGRLHVDTLSSYYWLAQSLYDSDKYEEAEELFRQNTEDYELVHGVDSTDAQTSRYYVGQCLYRQGQHVESELVFRQCVNDAIRLLGSDDVDTLNRNYWLAHSIFSQLRYREAAPLFRQSAMDRERILGEDDPDTLASRHWQALALFEQQKADKVSEEADTQSITSQASGSTQRGSKFTSKDTNRLFGKKPRNDADNESQLTMSTQVELDLAGAVDETLVLLRAMQVQIQESMAKLENMKKEAASSSSY